MEVAFPPPRDLRAVARFTQMAAAWLLFVVRAPFPADSYSVCLASQKKLLKHLIVLDKVITRYDGFNACKKNDCAIAPLRPHFFAFWLFSQCQA